MVYSNVWRFSAKTTGWRKRIRTICGGSCWKRTGQVERVEQRHGPESKVTGAVEEQVRTWVRQQPDLTLGEIQERLWETARLLVSVARVWQVLRRLKLRLKKSH